MDDISQPTKSELTTKVLEAKLEKAKSHIESKEYKASMEVLRGILKKNPEHQTAKVVLRKALLAADSFVTIKRMRKIAREAYDQGDYLVSLANILVALGKDKENVKTQKYFRKILNGFQNYYYEEKVGHVEEPGREPEMDELEEVEMEELVYGKPDDHPVEDVDVRVRYEDEEI